MTEDERKFLVQQMEVQTMSEMLQLRLATIKIGARKEVIGRIEDELRSMLYGTYIRRDNSS